MASHPSWVCGLKQTEHQQCQPHRMSHPSWVCGLKLKAGAKSYSIKESHPSWVCGLKLLISSKPPLATSVTPFVGVWIETGYRCFCSKHTEVTPFVGVWIETMLQTVGENGDYSHTLRGCVD